VTGKLWLAGLAVLWGASFAEARDVSGRPLPAARSGAVLGTISGVWVSPGSISFQATNPASGAASGSSAASITWTVLDGSPLQVWTLSVQADSSAFLGCPAVPASAVRAVCSSASVSGGGGSGACSSAFPLSTLSRQVAAGAEGSGNNSYSVLINYTLAESWRYPASNGSCTLTLTYTVNAP
jgi:hypothetical protein